MSGFRLTIEEAMQKSPDMKPGQRWRGGKKKYQFGCEQHNVYTQTYSNHRDGEGCPFCAREKIIAVLRARALLHKLDFACDYCGKRVTRNRGIFNKSEKHFCCRECSFTYRSEHSRGHILPSGYRIKHGSLEHRLVMAKHLGLEKLPRDATVHHINGNRADNRIQNLELWIRNHGAGQRLSNLISLLRKLGYEVKRKRK